MPYLILLVVLLAWALWAIRSKLTWRRGVSLFFTGSFFTIIAEPSTTRLLDLYAWRLQLLQDKDIDFMAGSYVVGLFLDPLLGVIYTAYCDTRPVLKAFLASLTLGVLEFGLLHTAYMEYLWWHPWVSVGAFTAFFLMVWRLNARGALLAWLTVHGASLWVGAFLDILPHGMLWLRHYTISITGDTLRDDRIVTALTLWFVTAPVTTIVSMIRTQSRWVWVIAGAGTLFLFQQIEVALGALVYHGWNAWLTLAQSYINVGSVAMFTNWLRATGPAEDAGQEQPLYGQV